MSNTVVQKPVDFMIPVVPAHFQESTAFDIIPDDTLRTILGDESYARYHKDFTEVAEMLRAATVETMGTDENLVKRALNLFHDRMPRGSVVQAKLKENGHTQTQLLWTTRAFVGNCILQPLSFENRIGLGSDPRFVVSRLLKSELSPILDEWGWGPFYPEHPSQVVLAQALNLWTTGSDEGIFGPDNTANAVAFAAVGFQDTFFDQSDHPAQAIVMAPLLFYSPWARLGAGVIGAGGSMFSLARHSYALSGDNLATQSLEHWQNIGGSSAVLLTSAATLTSGTAALRALPPTPSRPQVKIRVSRGPIARPTSQKTGVFVGRLPPSGVRGGDGLSTSTSRSVLVRGETTVASRNASANSKALQNTARWFGGRTTEVPRILPGIVDKLGNAIFPGLSNRGEVFYDPLFSHDVVIMPGFSMPTGIVGDPKGRDDSMWTSSGALVYGFPMGVAEVAKWLEWAHRRTIEALVNPRVPEIVGPTVRSETPDTAVHVKSVFEAIAVLLQRDPPDYAVAAIYLSDLTPELLLYAMTNAPTEAPLRMAWANVFNEAAPAVVGKLLNTFISDPQFADHRILLVWLLALSPERLVAILDAMYTPLHAPALNQLFAWAYGDPDESTELDDVGLGTRLRQRLREVHAILVNRDWTAAVPRFTHPSRTGHPTGYVADPGSGLLVVALQVGSNVAASALLRMSAFRQLVAPDEPMRAAQIATITSEAAQAVIVESSRREFGAPARIAALMTLLGIALDHPKAPSVLIEEIRRTALVLGLHVAESAKGLWILTPDETAMVDSGMPVATTVLTRTGTGAGSAVANAFEVDVIVLLRNGEKELAWNLIAHSGRPAPETWRRVVRVLDPQDAANILATAGAPDAIRYFEAVYAEYGYDPQHSGRVVEILARLPEEGGLTLPEFFRAMTENGHTPLAAALMRDAEFYGDTLTRQIFERAFHAVVGEDADVSRFMRLSEPSPSAQKPVSRTDVLTLTQQFLEAERLVHWWGYYHAGVPAIVDVKIHEGMQILVQILNGPAPTLLSRVLSDDQPPPPDLPEGIQRMATELLLEAVWEHHGEMLLARRLGQTPAGMRPNPDGYYSERYKPIPMVTPAMIHILRFSALRLPDTPGNRALRAALLRFSRKFGHD